MSTKDAAWNDVNVGDMLLDGKKMNLDIDAHLTDAQLARTIEGASTVGLTVYDAQRKLLTSGILASQIDIQVDMFKFSLVQVAKQGTSLTITFEDWLVNQLRKKNKPIKAKRGNTTRAEFAKRLVDEIPGAKFVCPELHKTQPIAKKSQTESTAAKDANKSNGFPAKNSLTVKGQKMSGEQMKNADIILQVGKSLGADGFTMVTAIAVSIQESSLVNLTGGLQDSIGLFQQRPSQGWGSVLQVHDPAHASNSFFTRAIKYRKDHPSWTLAQLGQAVQRSGHPDAPARWTSEAQAIYNAWSGSDEFPGITSTSTKAYEFHRGGAGHLLENSWQCLQRLADEVHWRCFCIGMTIYFMPDRDLYKARPVDTINEDDEDIDEINFDYDLGKDVTHAEVTCHMRRWVAPPGSCIMIEKMGPVNGRWIVNDISRSLYSNVTAISLIKPRKVLPEPRASTSTGTSSNGKLKMVGDFGGDFVVRLLRQYVGGKYLYGANHNLSFTQLRDGDPTPPFDCSSFSRFGWAKGGHVDIGGDTGNQIAHAKSTHWQQGTGGPPPGGWLAGDLLFPHATHVAVATGEGTIVEAANHVEGIVEKPIYTSVFFWARPEPQA